MSAYETFLLAMSSDLDLTSGEQLGVLGRTRMCLLLFLYAFPSPSTPILFRRDFETQILQLQLAGKYVNGDCMIATRKYKCGLAFPECDENHVAADRPPCAEVCTNMCVACRIMPCPCYHMNDPSSNSGVSNPSTNGDISSCMRASKFESWLWGSRTLDTELSSSSKREATASLSLALMVAIVGAIVATTMS